MEKAHPDYGDADFEIESPFDAMRPIGSIPAITENPKSGDLPMKVDLEGDKVLILLAKRWQ